MSSSTNVGADLRDDEQQQKQVRTSQVGNHKVAVKHHVVDGNINDDNDYEDDDDVDVGDADRLNWLPRSSGSSNHTNNTTNNNSFTKDDVATRLHNVLLPCDSTHQHPQRVLGRVGEAVERRREKSVDLLEPSSAMTLAEVLPSPLSSSSASASTSSASTTLRRWRLPSSRSANASFKPLDVLPSWMPNSAPLTYTVVPAHMRSNSISVDGPLMMLEEDEKMERMSTLELPLQVQQRSRTFRSDDGEQQQRLHQQHHVMDEKTKEAFTCVAHLQRPISIISMIDCADVADVVGDDDDETSISASEEKDDDEDDATGQNARWASRVAPHGVAERSSHPNHINVAATANHRPSLDSFMYAPVTHKRSHQLSFSGGAIRWSSGARSDDDANNNNNNNGSSNNNSNNNNGSSNNNIPASDDVSRRRCSLPITSCVAGGAAMPTRRMMMDAPTTNMYAATHRTLSGACLPSFSSLTHLEALMMASNTSDLQPSMSEGDAQARRASLLAEMERNGLACFTGAADASVSRSTYMPSSLRDVLPTTCEGVGAGVRMAEMLVAASSSPSSYSLNSMLNTHSDGSSDFFLGSGL